MTEKAKADIVEAQAVLEKVARALVASYVASSGTSPAELDRVWETGKEGWLEAARAALQALRDGPSVKKVPATVDGRYADSVTVHADGWAVMIDSVLSGQPSPPFPRSTED